MGNGQQSMAQGEGLREVAVNRQSFFQFNSQSLSEADLIVRVTCK